MTEAGVRGTVSQWYYRYNHQRDEAILEMYDSVVTRTIDQSLPCHFHRNDCKHESCGNKAKNLMGFVVIGPVLCAREYTYINEL